MNSFRLLNLISLIIYSFLILSPLIHGSYVNGRSNNLSDIDIMIIKDNYESMDIGSKVIDNIRVEFFIQDIKKLYELLKIEIDNNDPSHLTKFATCKIIYDKDNITAEFIDYATNLYNTKIDKEYNDYTKFEISGINNKLEDLYSLLDKDSFYTVYFNTL